MPTVEPRAADRPGPPEGVPAAVLDRPIVLYDGVCGLCARSVRWILHHERDHELTFAPLQGPTAEALRSRWPQIPAAIDTVVFIESGRVHVRSKAFLHLASHLRAPWRWMHALRWVPGFLPDLGYRVIAAVRYRVWGKADTCELPAPEQRARFLP
ncbi:MAG: thiol-disulfide oxidoreductase DCC family protein [Kofleriaceae bacterium]